MGLENNIEALDEIWRPVRDYEDKYEISNLGRIRITKARMMLLEKQELDTLESAPLVIETIKPQVAIIGDMSRT